MNSHRLDLGFNAGGVELVDLAKNLSGRNFIVNYLGPDNPLESQQSHRVTPGIEFALRPCLGRVRYLLIRLPLKSLTPVPTPFRIKGGRHSTRPVSISS